MGYGLGEDIGICLQLADMHFFITVYLTALSVTIVTRHKAQHSVSAENEQRSLSAGATFSQVENCG